MAIRIQPLEVKIPPDDPFRHDLLGRQEPAEVLTHLLGSIEGPCVLTIDGAWGSGKTTFLTMWTQYLINQGFPVVNFNAWETDYSAVPFISLATALAAGPEHRETSADPSAVERFREIAERVVPWVMPALGTAVLATIGAVGGDPAAAVPLTEMISRLATNRLSEFPDAQQSVEKFKVSFGEMAAEISEASGDLPLIIAIDELDRCRPTFAIELLETAKHLFMADHVVFVLAMNRQELCHSIKAVYGSGFDADGYLRRFVDIDFRLPNPDRQPFVEQLLERTQIDHYFQRTNDKTHKGNYREILSSLGAIEDLSIRTIAQTIHRLALVLASLPDKQRSLAEVSVLALLLRATDMQLYEQFTRGQASDADCVDAVFGSLPNDKRFTPIVAWFEALIIAALVHRPNDTLHTLEQASTPLIRRYREIQGSVERPDLADDPSVRHAHYVLTRAESIIRERWEPRDLRSELNWVVRRIELLSPEFTADQQSAEQ